jgi:hypothetical protein
MNTTALSSLTVTAPGDGDDFVAAPTISAITSRFTPLERSHFITPSGTPLLVSTWTSWALASG